MSINGIVYKITNRINGKSYIGVTCKSIEERFEAHYSKAIKERSAIQKALHKYGKLNFSIEQIDTATSMQELFEKEIFWIKTHDTFNIGYNLTVGGGGIPNMPQEIRDKISISKTGKSIAKLKGRKVSESTKDKISKKLNGKKIKLTNIDTNEVIILNRVNDAKEFGISPGNVVECCKGKRTHTKRYICEYL